MQEAVQSNELKVRDMSSRFISDGRRSAVTRTACVVVFCAMPLTVQIIPAPRAMSLFSNPPEAHSPIALAAINDPKTGKAAFWFEGREASPGIRAMPGEDIRITYVNATSDHSQEICINDLVMDFTDPIIRGVSLFHCHLLGHEDKGMMAKILFRSRTRQPTMRTLNPFRDGGTDRFLIEHGSEK